MYGVLRLFESALFYFNNNLMSCTIDDETKKYQTRDFFMSDEVFEWLHHAYQNMNELPYFMLYNSIDSNGMLNPDLKNGISGS